MFNYVEPLIISNNKPVISESNLILYDFNALFLNIFLLPIIGCLLAHNSTPSTIQNGIKKKPSFASHLTKTLCDSPTKVSDFVFSQSDVLIEQSFYRLYNRWWYISIRNQVRWYLLWNECPSVIFQMTHHGTREIFLCTFVFRANVSEQPHMTLELFFIWSWLFSFFTHHSRVETVLLDSTNYIAACGNSHSFPVFRIQLLIFW